MSEVSLAELRQKVDSSANPFKVVRRDAIEYIGRLDDGTEVSAPYEGYGKNVYRVEGTELLVNDLVSKQLDGIIGLTPTQAKIVRNASGEIGVRDFRNYLATAGSMMKPVSVALIANPSSRTVSGLVAIKEEPITSDAFFDFLELFLDKNDLYPVRYQMAYDIAAGFTLFLDSNNPDVRQIAHGEDFLVNSYYLKWNLGQIELGRYYERLICSNGQTETVRHKEARISTVREDRISGIMDIPRNNGLLNDSFERFRWKALEAMEVRASIAELKLVSDKLDHFLIDNHDGMAIAPYGKELQMYLNAGYDGAPDHLNQMKASMSVWELYNAVTDYASNNSVWDKDDNRRGMLQGEALRFLMRERDVKNYSDVFSKVREFSL